MMQIWILPEHLKRRRAFLLAKSIADLAFFFCHVLVTTIKTVVALAADSEAQAIFDFFISPLIPFDIFLKKNLTYY